MLVNLETVLFQAAPANGATMQIFLMVGLFVVMYFFMIRPQSKKAKEQKKFSESINLNDQIITTAGIHGRISRVNEDGTLKIEVNHGTFMTIERSAVSMEMTTAYRKKMDGATATTTATTTAATTK